MFRDTTIFTLTLTAAIQSACSSEDSARHSFRIDGSVHFGDCNVSVSTITPSALRAETVLNRHKIEDSNDQASIIHTTCSVTAIKIGGVEERDGCSFVPCEAFSTVSPA